MLSAARWVAERSKASPAFVDPLRDRLAERALDRKRLACQRRLVQIANPLLTVPSTATTSPCPTKSRSPGSMYPSATSSRRPSRWRRAVRGTRESSAVISRLARLRRTFQVLTARIHQSDDDSRKMLAERQRAAHRERGHNVQAYVAAP